MSEWVLVSHCAVCANQSPIQLLSIDSISVLALPFILIKKFYCAYFFYLIGITSYRLISYPIVSNWIGSDRIGSYESVALSHTHGMSLSLSLCVSVCGAWEPALIFLCMYKNYANEQTAGAEISHEFHFRVLEKERDSGWKWIRVKKNVISRISFRKGSLSF